MLKRVWVSLLVIAATACTHGGRSSSPHEQVACVGCHRAGAGAAARSAVPNEACASRRCHPDGGPDSVTLSVVTFKHANHPDGVGGSVACAACHTHGPDSLSLHAGTTACALCHFRQIAAGSDSACATCHAHPRHVRRTSQGLQLPHASLDSAHVPCTRCHYRLVEQNTVVDPARCRACHPHQAGPRLPGDTLNHAAVDTVQSAAASHASHRELACIACHEKVVHRVVAMSSSIELRCTSCHALRHSPPIPADSAPDSTCAGCHADVHQDEQRLVLGLLPGDSARPSAMFMGGVTCQSCHIASNQQPPAPGKSLRGTAASCTGCHGGAWGTILGRWQRGYARRDGWVRDYLAAARRATGEGAGAPVRAKLREAQDLLDFTRRAGPLHNLPVADRLMRHAVSLTSDAYRLAGLPVPPLPRLGPPVENGTCISCHYGIEEARIRATSDTAHVTTHGDHLFGGGLTCDACHAVGAAPPGVGGGRWIDSIPGARTTPREPARPRP